MRVKTIATRRRGGVTAASWLSLTSWARPQPPTPAAAYALGWTMVPFNSSGGLTSALSAVTGTTSNVYIWYSGPGALPTSGDMAGGTFYHGSGALNITSGSSTPVSFSARNPAGPVVVDLGCSHNQWDASKITTNYVHIAYTGTANVNAVSFINCTNLHIYGGDITTSTAGGVGVINQAPLLNCSWHDAYVHDTGTTGFSFRGQDGSNNASFIRGYKLRVEINKFAQNPNYDSHADLGTGIHGANVHGTTGEISGCTMAVHAHDPLAPGDSSLTRVWLEGSGGCVIELGNSSGGPLNNMTIYAKGENLLMHPNGTNSTPTSTVGSGGSIVNCWGTKPLDNNVFPWIQGNNCSGAMFHGTPQTAPNAWFAVSTSPPTPIVVLHGRGTSMNQYTGGGNQSQKYMSGFSVSYNDCT